MKTAIILFAILYIIIHPLSAQSVRAVIVQLNTEQNKIRYFRKTGNNKEAESLSREAAEMQKKMISDFNDNFAYCPVYYYIDTNAELIRNKQFKDVLLYMDGIVVKESVINVIDSDYLIVRYGFSETNSAVRTGKGLAVCDAKFNQLAFYEHATEVTMKQYVYISKKYDVEYYPCAKTFDYHLRRKYE